MKKKLPIIGIALILLAGICFLAYPLVSSVINNFASRSNAHEYTETIKRNSSEENQALIKSAQDYNASLNNHMVITDPFDTDELEKTEIDYENALNVNGSGLIGYIDIPKINVYLDIYHGTGSDVLDRYAGHLQNTSLPVGGENTHSVISAHTGYPGNTFFDYLVDMEKGDEFFIHIADKTLKYEVDSIKVVLPHEMEDLRIVEGEDYVTLLTCTPYGANTHRLLVRGTRVEYDDSEYITTGASVIAFQDYIYLLGYKIPYWAAGTFVLGIIVFVTVTVIFIKRKAKKEKH